MTAIPVREQAGPGQWVARAAPPNSPDRHAPVPTNLAAMLAVVSALGVRWVPESGDRPDRDARLLGRALRQLERGGLPWRRCGPDDPASFGGRLFWWPVGHWRCRRRRRPPLLTLRSRRG